MYKLQERLCDWKLNDHFVSPCRTTRVYFVLFNFYSSFFYSCWNFMFALIFFFFSLSLPFLLFRSGAISVLFLSLDESFIFLFFSPCLDRVLYIFLYKFLSRRARDNFLSMLLLWSLNLFVIFIFFFFILWCH